MLRNDLAPTLSLDGVWEFHHTAGAVGEIAVPGCWEAQGYPKTLDGPVFYRRPLHIPAGWADGPVIAEFDAVSYAAEVRCNGQTLGRHQGLWTPFAVDLTSALRPGDANQLEVEVVKPCHRLEGGLYPLRTTLAGFLPDLATTFGGIWQSTRLRLLRAGFDGLRIDSDPAGVVRVAAKPLLPTGAAHAEVRTTIRFQDRLVAADEAHIGRDEQIERTLQVPDPLLWRPGRPALYHVQVDLVCAGRRWASATERIGFRRLHAVGEQLLLNEQPIGLRGVLSWSWEPERIAPRFSAEEARSEMRRLAALGFNLIKLCLFVPNRTYYEVADEMGMLLWQEWPLWLPDVTPELRGRAPGEYAEYMALTRHHPSVVVYSLGCELDQSVDRKLLAQLDAVVRGATQGALCCDNSGSGEAYGGLVEEFADFVDYHTYGELHYLEPTLDHWRRDWRRPRPWLFGEFCDSDGFRDRERLLAANGGAPPWWMTAENPACAWRPEMKALLEAEARLEEAQPGFSPAELIGIANAQSRMVRKVTLEAVRRRQAVQGYVITGLRDTPIATSGILDDFGAAKWLPEAFRPFNDDAVLCLDVGRSRVWRYGGDRAERLDPHCWWCGEPVRLSVILNQTSVAAVDAGTLTWDVRDGSGRVVAAGVERIADLLRAGGPCEAGVVAFTAEAGERAQALTLSAHFEGCGVRAENAWPLWVFPRPRLQPEAVALYDPAHELEEEWTRWAHRRSAGELGGWSGPLIAAALDEPLLAFLATGGRVLLLQTGDAPLPARRQPFWREALKLPLPHPLWEHFPHAGFVDLQFWGLATDVSFDTPRLDAALSGLRSVMPILRRLDARAFTASDYLFDGSVGRGRLIGCSLRLQGGAGAQPTGLARNVAGQWLLAGLLAIL